MRENSVLQPISPKSPIVFGILFYCMIALIAAILLLAALSSDYNPIMLAGGIVFLTAILAAYLYAQKKNGSLLSGTKAVVVLLIVGIVVRLVLAAAIYGYKTDIACFVGWSTSAFSGGLNHFYTSGQFADYPPLYMYVLYFLGALANIFQITAWVFLVKMPAILCDVIIAFFAYNIARKNFAPAAKENALSHESVNPVISVLVFACIMLNPAIIMNSAVWGQIDMIYTLMVVACVYLLINKKITLAIIIFALTILLKVQGVLLGPALLFFVISGLANRETRKNTLVQLLAGIGIAFGLCILLIMPFNGGRPITWIFQLYANSLGGYGYVTVNGFNLYGLLGLNWALLSKTFLGLSFTVWGTIGIAAVFCYSIWLYKLYPAVKNLFNITAFVVLGVYMFAQSMHERYSFAAPVLLLFSYLYLKDKRLFFASLLTSGTVLANQCFALQYDGLAIPYPIMALLSAINLIAFAYSAVVITKIALNHKKLKKVRKANENG